MTTTETEPRQPKRLPTSFFRDKYLYTQPERTNEVALYRMEKGGFIRYEVILIQRARNDYTFPNGFVVLASSESFPSTEQWGSKGWTLTTHQRALEKYNELIKSNN